MNAPELISPEPSRRTMNGLRELLFRQLDDLRAGKISSGQASASAKLAVAILATVNTQISLTDTIHGSGRFKNSASLPTVNLVE
jgi:hypothetical protein